MGRFIEYVERSRPHINFIREYASDDCSVRERIPFVVGLSNFSYEMFELNSNVKGRRNRDPWTDLPIMA